MNTMSPDHSNPCLLSPTPRPRHPHIFSCRLHLHVFSSFVIIIFSDSLSLTSVACQKVGWCFWLDLMQIAHRHPRFWWAQDSSGQPCHVQKTVRPSIIGSYSLPTLSSRSLSLWGERIDINVPFRADHSPVPYSQHFNHLGVSALTAAHCTKKLSGQSWEQH